MPDSNLFLISGGGRGLFFGFVVKVFSDAVIAVAVKGVDEGADGKGGGGDGKTAGNADLFRKKAGQQGSQADADVVGKHVGGVGRAAEED